MIEEVDIIPLDGDINRVARCANQLLMYDDSLKRNIPDIMLMVMQNMHDYYVHLKTTVTSHTLYKNDDAYLVSRIIRRERGVLNIVKELVLKLSSVLYLENGTSTEKSA